MSFSGTRITVPQPQIDLAPGGWEELRAPVGAELAEVEERIGQVLGSASQLASEALHHIHQAGGKRLRPLICLLSARAAEDCSDLALRCALAVEIVHLASLLHDDVVDQSDTRRGRETVRKRWGNRVSVLAGDFLAARAYHELALGKHLFAVETLASAVASMCEAELLYAQQSEGLPDEELYLTITAGKTAALMQAAARLGAWSAGAEGYICSLSQYGRCLGMAFQIGDDLLDLYGDSHAMGKPNGADVAAGQFTLPVIHALTYDGQGQLEALLSRLREEGSGAAPAGLLGELVEQLGGRDYAQQRMGQFAAEAQTALTALPDSEARDALHDLADRVCERSA